MQISKAVIVLVAAVASTVSGLSIPVASNGTAIGNHDLQGSAKTQETAVEEEPSLEWCHSRWGDQGTWREWKCGHKVWFRGVTSTFDDWRFPKNCWQMCHEETATAIRDEKASHLCRLWNGQFYCLEGFKPDN